MKTIDYQIAMQAFEDSGAYESSVARWPKPEDDLSRAEHIFIAGYNEALRNERRPHVVAVVEWRIEGHTTWVRHGCNSRTGADILKQQLRNAAELLSYDIEITEHQPQGFDQELANKTYDR